MAESRLQRWSRKKNEAGNKPEPITSPVVEPEQPPEEQELAINEAMPEHELLAKYDLPDPDAIELGMDITGFMRQEIPEFLRRRALRSLWRSNPVLAVLDGLNDYDEDFTAAANGTSAVKTLYKVGQGMFDKEARKAEKLAEEQAAAAENHQTAERVEEQAGESEPQAAVESLPVTSLTDAGMVSSEKRTEEKVVAEADEKPAPLYRPRMRFEY